MYKHVGTALEVLKPLLGRLSADIWHDFKDTTGQSRVSAFVYSLPSSCTLLSGVTRRLGLRCLCCTRFYIYFADRSGAGTFSRTQRERSEIC